MPARQHDDDKLEESVKLIFDLTSRIDERVKMLVEKQGESDEKIEKIMDLQQSTIQRVAILEISQDTQNEMQKEIDDIDNKLQIIELKCEKLQMRSTQQDTTMNRIFEWVLKILFMVVGGLILFKLGLQAPPN